MAEQIKPQSGDDTPIGIQVNNEINAIEQDYQRYKPFDPSIEKKDTATFIIDLLKRVKKAMEQIMVLDDEERERNYWVVYNGTLTILTFTRDLRKWNFSIESKDYLAYAILCVDSLATLSTVKYANWRVQLYIEMCSIYEELNSITSALNVAAYGLTKIEYIKQIETQDPPVPPATEAILQEAMRIMRTFHLKYSAQAEVLNADNWKKKLAEYFGSNKLFQSLAIAETLNSLNPEWSNIFGDKGCPKWKPMIIKIAHELLKDDLELLQKALKEQRDLNDANLKRKQEIADYYKKMEEINKKKKEEEQRKAEEEAKQKEKEAKEKEEAKDPKKKDEKKKKADAKEEKDKPKQEGEELPPLSTILERHEEEIAQMVKEKEWKKVSLSIPLKVHSTILLHCIHAKCWNEYEYFYTSLKLRIELRVIETPFVTDITINASIYEDCITPNDYEELPQDLNIAHLKGELAKLRSGQITGSSKISRKVAETKKEGKGKQDTKKDAKKKEQKKEQKKDAKAKKQADATEEEVEQPKLYTQEELDMIEHPFVHILLKRGRNADEAICNLGITVVNAKETPKCPPSIFGIPIPIDLHNSSADKISYLLFQRTENSLKNEEEKLSCIKDLYVLCCDNPNHIAPFGYVKMPVDIRQTPKNLERLPNLQYVYLCYQTAEEDEISIKDYEIGKCIANLEKSHSSEGISELQKLLNVDFSMESLQDLMATSYKNTLGPVGELFVSKRKTFLTQLVAYLWIKYLQPVFYQLRYANDLITNEEYSEQVEELLEEIEKNKKLLCTIMANAFLIISKTEFYDPIITSEIGLHAAMLCEDYGDYHKAIEILRTLERKITEYREGELKSPLDSSYSPNIFKYITCSGYKIDELTSKMNDNIKQWISKALRRERQNARKQKEEDLLPPEQLDDEEYKLGGLNQKEHKGIAIPNQKYSDIEFNANGLHSEIVAALYRCEVKSIRVSQTSFSKTITTLKANKVDMGNAYKGIASTLIKKMSINKGETATKIKKDYKQLEQSLQETKMLPPPRPEYNHIEKLLLQEVNFNLYQKVLLLIAIGSQSLNLQHQRAISVEIEGVLKELETEESKMIEEATSNAIYVIASRYFNPYFKVLPTQNSTLNMIFSDLHYSQQQSPSKPILISRTTTTMSYMLPYFKPENPKVKVSTMALFGKTKGSGTAVSLTNNDIKGTDIKYPVGSVVMTSMLTPNEKYVFASAAYNESGNTIGGIGATAPDVTSLLPLPLISLYAVFAEYALSIYEYEQAENAAMMAITNYITKKDLYTLYLDSKFNPSLQMRISPAVNIQQSTIENKMMIKALIVMCECIRKQLDGTFDRLIEKQKLALKISRFMIIATELTIMTKEYYLQKRVLCYVFNVLSILLSYESIVPLLFEPLIKMHYSLISLPSQYYDTCIRKASSKINYYLVNLCLQQRESQLLNSIITNELLIESRKWKIQSRIAELKDIEEETAKDTKTKSPKAKDPGDAKKAENKKGEAKEGESPKDEGPKMIKEALEYDIEGNSFEEYLMSLGDGFKDYASKAVARWKAKLAEYSSQVTSSESIDKITNSIDYMYSFYESLTTGSQEGFDYVQSNYDTPEYWKYISYALNRGIECAYEKNIDNIDNLELPEEITKTTELVQSKSQELLKDVVALRIKLKKHIEDEILKIEGAYDDKFTTMMENVKAYLISAKKQKESSRAHYTQEEIIYGPDIKWIASIFLSKIISHYQKEVKERGIQTDKTGETSNQSIKHIDFMIFREKMAAAQKLTPPTTLKTVLETCCIGCIIASKAKLWTVMLNMIFMLWNYIRAELIEPEMIEDLWPLLNIIIEACEPLISKLIAGENIRDSSRVVRFDMEEVTAKKEDKIMIFGNIYGLLLQCMMLKEKYEVLVDSSDTFNRITKGFFAPMLRPFILFALNQLYIKENANLESLNTKLDSLVKQYKEWKTQNKKKQTRSSLLSGEVPKEKTEFKQNRTQMRREIFLSQCLREIRIIEKKLQEEEAVLANRDANAGFELMCQSRKIKAKYGRELKMLLDAKETEDVVRKKRMCKSMGDMLIQNYNKACDLFRKRGDNPHLIQALSELGDLCFSINDAALTLQNWGDSLDTIFKQFNFVQTFREVFNAPFYTIVNKVGTKNCFYSIILLWKLSKNCFYNDEEKQHNCATIASMLIPAFTKLMLPQPQHNMGFSLYTMRDIDTNLDLFSDPYELCVGDVICSISYFIDDMVSRKLYSEAIPSCTVLEYFAYQHASYDYCSIKAQCCKAIAVGQCGGIKESINILLDTSAEIDMSNIKACPFNSYSKGLFKARDPKATYKNSEPWFDSDNNLVLSKLAETEISEYYNGKYSPTTVSWFILAKAAIINKALEKENWEATDKNVERLTLLKKTEERLRNAIASLSKSDDLCIYRQKLSKLLNDGAITTEKMNEAMIAYVQGKGITQTEVDKYYEHMEEGRNIWDIRADRLKIMALMRIQIARILEIQYLYLDAFFSVKMAARLLSSAAIDQCKPFNDTGIDEKNDFSLPENLVASQAGQKLGAKKDEKKDTKAKKEAPTKAKGKEEPKKEDEKVTEMVSNCNLASDGRRICSIHVWCSVTKYYLKLLCKMKRYEDSNKFIEILNPMYIEYNEWNGIRLINEVKAYSYSMTGQTEAACKSFEEAKKIGEDHKQDDVDYIMMLANMSEYYNDINKKEEALAVLKIARGMIWKRMKTYGIEINDGSVNKEYTDASLSTTESEIKETLKDTSNASFEFQKLDYTKENHITEQKSNTTSLEFHKPSIYLPLTEELIKIDERYIELSLGKGDNTQLISTLDDTFKILNKTIMPSFSLQFRCLLLHSTINFSKAIQLMLEFQQPLLQLNRYSKFTNYVLKTKIIRGDQLRLLPNYTSLMETQVTQLLNSCTANIEKAIKMGYKESVFYEFPAEYDQAYALILLSSIQLLKYQYLPVDPKDESAEQTNSINSLYKAYAFRTFKSKLINTYHTIVNTSLIDPSSIPKECISEIFEANLNKTKDKAKAVLSSSDIISYLFSVSNELKMFTLWNGCLQKTISKIHRSLASNLSTYHLIEKEYVDTESAAHEMEANEVLVVWTNDGSDRVMDYALGATTTELKHLTEEQKGKTIRGRIRYKADNVELLYKGVSELNLLMQKSSALSEEIFKRDREVYYTPIYNGLYCRLLNEFSYYKIEEVPKDMLEKAPALNADNTKFFKKLYSQEDICEANEQWNVVLKVLHGIQMKQ